MPRLTKDQKRAIFSSQPGRTDDLEAGPELDALRLDLDQLTEAQLKFIPGLDPAAVAKVLAGRPYFSLEELVAASGLSRALWEELVHFEPLVLPDGAAGTDQTLIIARGQFVAGDPPRLTSTDTESAEGAAMKAAVDGALVPVVYDKRGRERYFVPGQLDVWCRDGLDPASLFQRAGLVVVQAVPAVGYYRVRLSDAPPRADLLRLALRRVRWLNQQPEVRFAELDELGVDDLPPPTAAPPATDTEQAEERGWHLEQIGLPEAHQLTRGANNVVVFVIDTGMRTDHPALSPGLPPSWTEWDLNFEADQDPGFASPHTGPGGDSHGTRVAGIIRQVAPNCRVVPLKITATSGQQAGYGLRAAAIRSAVAALRPGERGVINLSWKTQSDHGGIREALRDAEAAEVAIVTSAGNFPRAANEEHFPSDYWRVAPFLRGLCAVAAVGAGDRKASYTFYGDRSVNLCAPGGESGGDGVGVYTTSIVPDFTWSHGTSFAAPHVAGLLGLLFSVQPTLPVTRARELLQENGANIDDKNPGFEGKLGRRIDAARTLRAAVGQTPPPVDGAKLNLNLASADEIRALGVVSALVAARIVEDRAARGPFLSVTTLLRVPGLTVAWMRALEPRVFV